MPIKAYAIEDISKAQIDRWDALLVASPVNSAFLSYSFCRAVADARGGVTVLHIQEDAEGEGFLPLQLRAGRSLLRHGENVARGMSDFFGIAGNLKSEIGADELLRAAGLSALRFDHGVRDLCPFRFDDAESGRGARFVTPSFSAFTDRLLAENKDFVKSVFSRERRLARELGPIEFVWKSGTPADLERHISAKRDQYRRTGVPDSLAEGWRRKLLERLWAMPGGKTCETVLSTINAGGVWIASKLSLICAGSLHSWFSVYDPQHRRHGPGHLLWFKVIEAGCARGIHTFDFGEGESDYKAEYGGEGYDVWKGVLRSNTVSGNMERVLQSASWRLERLAGQHRTKPLAEKS